MKLHIVKSNGDSIFIPDVRIVHVDEYVSVEERSDNIQLWSDPKQHENVKHRTEIVFTK
jgi:hypothetical protein